MNRAVITFSDIELNEIIARLKFDQADRRYGLLQDKLNASNQQLSSDKSSQQISLEVSEDDLEFILDEFIMPSPNEAEQIVSIRKKIHTILQGFRTQN